MREKFSRAGVSVTAPEFILVGEADRMNQKIQMAPFCPAAPRKPRVDAGDVLDIAGQYDLGTQRLHREQLEALGLRLALIGESQFRALGRERFGDAPGIEWSLRRP